MTTRNDAGFYAPLKTTLVPTNGSGAPTLTRSTAMWVFDNEDKLVNVPASAAAFGGARMVRNNYIPNTLLVGGTSGVLGSGGTAPAGWTAASNTGTVTYADSAESGHKTMRFQAAAQRPYIQAPAFAVNSGEVWIAKVRIVDNTVPASSTQFMTFTGVTYTAEYSSANTALGYFTLKATFTASGNATFRFGGGCSGNSTSDVTTDLPQVENVTGQADQTASDEYVSNGVLAAPYHGAGIDGVKWFNTHKDGTPIPPSSLLGLATNEAAVTNTMLWCRDFTNPVWVATNVTAAKTQTGLDNVSNSCSLITFTANGGTILQTITASASAGCTGWYVTRAAGSGNLYITRDNGSTWTDITSQINSETPTLVKIENTVVLNPVVGFKGNNGDAIIVDGGINHLGTKLHYLPILTTSAAVTVGAQTLTYPTSGNISNTVGTIIATVKQDTWSSGSVVGSATTGLFSSASNSGVQARDGTNTVSGVPGTPSGSQHLGMRWTSSFLQAFSGDEFGIVGSYDGSLNLTTIGIMPGISGYIKDVAIFQTYVSNSEILSILGLRLNNIFNNDVAIAFFKANGFPTEYNDGLLAWLRNFYSVENTTWPLADLLARYLREYGTTFPESVLTEFLLLEDGFKLLQEDGFRITLETSGTNPVATLGPYLLLEDGSFILQEDNNKFLLEA